MTTTPEVSHGRGGAGNITPDNTKYVDGEVVRAGAVGSHEDGAFSTGRGGAGNIGDEGKEPVKRADADVVPPEAVRASAEGDYHVGRGGAGNEHVAAEDHAGRKSTDKHPTPGAKQPVSLADKLKGKILGVFKK